MHPICNSPGKPQTILNMDIKKIDTVTELCEKIKAIDEILGASEHGLDKISIMANEYDFQFDWGHFMFDMMSKKIIETLNAERERLIKEFEAL